MAGLLGMVVNNPEIAESIAQEVGIDKAETETVIAQLTPLLMGAAKHNMQSSRDSGELLKQIGDSQFSNMIDAPKQAVKQQNFTDIGNIVLGQLTGSKENSRKVAQHIQSETGISDMIIKQILPMIAPFIVGALGKKAAPTIHKQEQSGGIGSGLEDILIGMIDQDHDGSIIDDVLQMAMKRFFS